jgi:hypothetical protein
MNFKGGEPFKRLLRKLSTVLRNEKLFTVIDLTAPIEVTISQKYFLDFFRLTEASTFTGLLGCQSISVQSFFVFGK